ncbi:hypothetical protein M5D96_004011 [Drosophila gunungcola]|uniref:Uncharacterized protein n=1 Tax=Drosophila gunungcola TaxID=103775 RepID=A0A9Q0BSZ3_9MUSC|nr:hypothetical protein M5D96_004011 [Drosophila gunungcola]
MLQMTFNVVLSPPVDTIPPGQCKRGGRRDRAEQGGCQGCGRVENQRHAAYFNISGLISHSKQNGRQTCFRHQLHAPHLNQIQNQNQSLGQDSDQGLVKSICT